MTLDVEPAAGSLGAFVTGLDLTTELDAATLAALRAAILDHLVVFLPDQPMTLDDLERLTDQLGGRDVTPFVKPLDDRPYVIRVIKEPDDELNFANAWHTDLSYLPVPPSFTLLHAREVPDHGGDTVWANQYLAFETLSSGLQRDACASSTPCTRPDDVRHRRLPRLRQGQVVDGDRTVEGGVTASTCIRSSPAIPRPAARSCTSTRSTPPASTAGRTPRAPGCSPTSTAMPSTRTSRVG